MGEVSVLDKARATVRAKHRAGEVTTTPERLAQLDPSEVENMPSPGHGYRAGQRILAAPLDRLWKEKKITSREYLAGDRYRSDAYLAAVDPSTGSVDWAMAGGGGRGRYVPTMFAHQQCAEARIRWRRVSNIVTGIVDRIVHMTLIDERPLEDVGLAVFRMNNPPQARASALAGFRVALATLADVYDSMGEESRGETHRRSVKRAVERGRTGGPYGAR